MNESPFFSIFVSVYNRPEEIKRCVQSCLEQSFGDFEVIVVDDCSTDRTYAELEKITDPRVKLIRHSVNKGQGAARNNGVAAAKGDWLIRLDSDHALLSGALENLHQKCLAIPHEIDNIGARYRWDTGQITPYSVPEQPLDYPARIRWAEAEGGHDYVSCSRRRVFQRMRWFECMDTNSLMQLDQASMFLTQMYPDEIAMEYSDSPSILRSPAKLRWKMRTKWAHAQADYLELLLSKHGEALRKYGPWQFKRALRFAAFYSFLSGRKMKGLNYSVRYLKTAPGSFSGWMLLIFGVIGPAAMEFAYILRDRFALEDLAQQ